MGVGVGGSKVDVTRGILDDLRGNAGGATQATQTPKRSKPAILADSDVDAGLAAVAV